MGDTEENSYRYRERETGTGRERKECTRGAWGTLPACLPLRENLLTAGRALIELPASSMPPAWPKWGLRGLATVKD